MWTSSAEVSVARRRVMVSRTRPADVARRSVCRAVESMRVCLREANAS
ncbi:hypothetical protein SMD44_00109 [Streptomyces alboflavus]|uniref:Uncharacterized protein n=1 Tax=Streptomyces alboflavus TaxID=67267 RepID=A0A1Z1W2S0_9ACTN|nr:hypothetical protein SMD44_00109 [Streptomyces alboflavus]